MGYITSQRWSFFSAIMATHKSYYILNDNKYSCEASNFQSSLCFSESSTHLHLRCVSWHPLYFCRGARCWLWISQRWVHRTAATVKELICTSRLVSDEKIQNISRSILTWKHPTAQCRDRLLDIFLSEDFILTIFYLHTCGIFMADIQPQQESCYVCGSISFR